MDELSPGEILVQADWLRKQLKAVLKAALAAVPLATLNNHVAGAFRDAVNQEGNEISLDSAALTVRSLAAAGKWQEFAGLLKQASDILAG